MKILIVEDNVLMSDLICQMLGALGFNDIVAADDGDTALRVCTKGLPDLVLLDWEMPRLDGMAFLTALRGLPDGERVEVIMCTGRDDVADISLALESGANDFIMKPFTADILMSKIALTGMGRAIADGANTPASDFIAKG